MKRLRQLHLHLGVFFTPLLLFFISTGWYQTVNPDRLKSPSEAESLVQKLRVVHTDQIFPETGAIRQGGSPKLFQALVVVMSIALILTTGLGLVLAFKFSRKLWPVWLSLGLGLAVPVLVLWVGQHR
jgi:hypothetical protein